ncbi:MAG: DUF1365 domain-containing protein [Paracoccaceae bacterium]
MTSAVDHVAGVTVHSRRGEIRHRFRYGVDMVMIDPEAALSAPALFSRNRFNLTSVQDRDHGGPMKQGQGPVWARRVMAEQGLDQPGLSLLLLTQPRYLGFGFNPVSFWLIQRGSELIAVIAEVSTPFGDRHSYFCHLPGFAPITASTWIETPKTLHVSPFQEVAGSYKFTFDFTDAQIAIRILHERGTEGVLATLSGPRQPLTNALILKASLRRPLGALRGYILIHWQALRLKLKGARYRSRPTPPKNEVT